MEFDKSQQENDKKDWRMKKFDDLVEEVKTFAILFKRALLTFYQIDPKSLALFQKNLLEVYIMQVILGMRITKALEKAATIAFREEYEEF